MDGGGNTGLSTKLAQPYSVVMKNVIVLLGVFLLSCVAAHAQGLLGVAPEPLLGHSSPVTEAADRMYDIARSCVLILTFAVLCAATIKVVYVVRVKGIRPAYRSLILCAVVPTCCYVFGMFFVNTWH